VKSFLDRETARSLRLRVAKHVFFSVDFRRWDPRQRLEEDLLSLGKVRSFFQIPSLSESPSFFMQTDDDRNVPPLFFL